MPEPRSTHAMAPAADEAFFRALEERRTRALVERDMATVDALHAPEYQLVTPAGRVFTREAYLDVLRSQPFYADWTIAGEMAFRLSPAMALLRYRARIVFPSGRVWWCWHTDSYEPRPPGWQAVWSQATEVRPVDAAPTTSA